MYKNIDNILKEDEKVLFNAKPKLKLFHRADWFMIPISLISVLPVTVLTFILLINPTGDWSWRILVLPFFLAFFYMSIGRFIGKLINKLNTYYYVTDRRVIIIRHIFKAKIKSAYLTSVKKITIDVKRKGTGDIIFFLSSELPNKFANYGFDFVVPKEGHRGLLPMIFYDINDAEDVYKKVYEIRSNA